jgi:hypothetical protein
MIRLPGSLHLHSVAHTIEIKPLKTYVAYVTERPTKPAFSPKK